MLQFEIDVVYLGVRPSKAVVHDSQEMHLLQALGHRLWIRPHTRNRCRKYVQARRWKHVIAESRGTARISSGLWARARGGGAQHVPNNETIDALLTLDDLSAQSRVDTGPYVETRVGSRVCADTPDHEFIGICWTFEDVGIVAICSIAHVRPDLSWMS